MPINFVGVNNGNGWKNSPNTSTPLNDINLNIDEAGIKAACNGVDSLDVNKVNKSDIVNVHTNSTTKVPSAALAKADHDLLTHVNDNLALFRAYQTLDTGYTSIITAVQDYYLIWAQDGGGTVTVYITITGGTYRVDALIATIDHGSCIIQSYALSQPLVGRKSGGSWVWNTFTVV